MRNVALFGGMAAGKSTLADSLCEQYGYAAYSLAWNLKAMVEEVYGTLDKSATVDVYNDDGPGTKSIREMLQGIGESVKQVDRDLWIKWFLKDCEMFEANAIPVVCDDGRMSREAEVLRDNGWLIVLIDTPAHVRWARYERRYGRPPSVSEAVHRTEKEIELIRYDLVVDGTLPVERQAELVIDMVDPVGHLS